MKLYRCISNKSGYRFTLHKIYQVDEGDRILITNDIGVQHFISKVELGANFINLQDERNDKLNKLGI